MHAVVYMQEECVTACNACVHYSMGIIIIVFLLDIHVGHGPFSHMFEYGVYEQLKLEYPREFLKV